MEYIKRVNKKYNFIITIIETAIISFILNYLDKKGLLVGKLVNLYKTNKGLTIFLLIVLFAIFICFAIAAYKNLFKKKRVNYFDRLLFLGLLLEIVYGIIIIGVKSKYKLLIYPIIIVNLVLIIIRKAKVERSK